MPIRRPCKWTAKALSFGSSFIAAVYGVERAFTCIIVNIASGMAMIPDQRLHSRHERPWDHQEVAVEHANQVEQSVESWHNLARLDPGYVHLRHAQMLPQFGLTPASLMTRLNQLEAHCLRQAIQAPAFDM